MNMLYPDKKALKILKEYDLLNQKETLTKDFDYAKKAGLMFDLSLEKHNENIEILFDEFKKISKKRITDFFLYSLSSNLLNYRSALSVYAIMQTFPFHEFDGFIQNRQICKFCGSSSKEMVDKSFFNQCRFFVGGIVSLDVYEFAFYLKQINSLEKKEPMDLDFEIFSNIINIIKNADEKDTPNILKKKLKSIPFFKSTEEQRIALIETLGYCSILENSKYNGFLTNYTVLSLAPTKAHSSDWRYPVDWWTGKNGVNEDAFGFWFGEYDNLKV